MEDMKTEISVRGKAVKVPCISIDGKTVVIKGKLIRIGVIKGERWSPPLREPDDLIENLKSESPKVDIFTFCQMVPDNKPRFKYYYEFESFAVASILDFEEWWKNLSQASRKNVRRAKKRGVVIRKMEFNDEFIRGIREIYNETPVRQGRKFWHYGKDLPTVKTENSTYLERSDFIGAYFEEELIGFVKVVYVGEVASIMQILSMGKHSDKRPTNALIAETAKVCSERGASHLIYGNYAYEGKAWNSLMEFKRRHSFEEVLVPRYYVPLTGKGQLARKLGFHKGIKSMLPTKMLESMRALRERWYHARSRAKE